MTAPPPVANRPLPELTPANEWFWTSGADGRLRVQGCTDCGTLVHPPVPICPACRSRAWEPTPGVRPRHGGGLHGQRPSVAAGLRTAVRDRQRRPRRGPGVRLTTNIVGCDPSEVHIGQEVTVRFEQHDDVWLPLFEPTGATDAPDPSREPDLPEPRAPLSDDRFEHRAVLSGVGRSAHRTPADGRSAVAHRRRLPGRGRRRRSRRSTTSTVCRPIPAPAAWG